MRENGRKKKMPVADSWEDEEVSSSSESEEDFVGETPARETENSPSWTRDGGEQSLVKVYQAFQMVRREFDELFFKMWA